LQHRCDYPFPACSRSSSATLLSPFLTARPFSGRDGQYSRQGHVRLQYETVFPKQSVLPSRRWMDRISRGTSGATAPLDIFFPLLRRRFDNLGSARCVLIGLIADQSGPPQHHRLKFKTRCGFSPALPMANLSRNVHRRRASILWGKIPDWEISPREPYGWRKGWCGVGKKRLFFPEIDVDQTQPGGVAHQVDGLVDPELAHDVGTMVFNRFGADEELFGGLAHA
jgi:hypothetical protein